MTYFRFIEIIMHPSFLAAMFTSVSRAAALRPAPAPNVWMRVIHYSARVRPLCLRAHLAERLPPCAPLPGPLRPVYAHVVNKRISDVYR